MDAIRTAGRIAAPDQLGGGDLIKGSGTSSRWRPGPCRRTAQPSGPARLCRRGGSAHRPCRSLLGRRVVDLVSPLSRRARLVHQGPDTRRSARTCRCRTDTCSPQPFPAPGLLCTRTRATSCCGSSPNEWPRTWPTSSAGFQPRVRTARRSRKVRQQLVQRKEGHAHTTSAPADHPPAVHGRGTEEPESWCSLTERRPVASPSAADTPQRGVSCTR
jgi:hypothetical protein